jgi:hypothetical protein
MDPYVERLRNSDNPSIAYRAHRRLDEQGEDEQGQRLRRQQIAETSNVRRLLSRRGPDGTIRHGNEYHCYRKFQGAHWTMAALAELGYPTGGRSLLPVVDQVHEWLSSPKHLSPPSTQVIPGQEDRVRRCASQEGLAIWYLHELGLVDERVDVLVSRLVDTSGLTAVGTVTRLRLHGLHRSRRPCCRFEAWPGIFGPDKRRRPRGTPLIGLPSSYWTADCCGAVTTALRSGRPGAATRCGSSGQSASMTSFPRSPSWQRSTVSTTLGAPTRSGSWPPSVSRQAAIRLRKELPRPSTQ